MRKLMKPGWCYIALAVIYLSLSDGQLPVHVLSLAVLAIAYLLPALLAVHLSSWRHRLAICVALAVAAMLVWDGSAHVVVSKAEPFSILRDTPWVYAPGIIVLVTMSFLTAWFASPPDKLIRRAR